MQDPAKNNVLSALLKALRPIARFLMKAGIGYREFAEISKCAFVDVATSDYGLRGRPTNISRVAVMTGLTRKEVKRLRDKIRAGNQIDMARVIPPAEILSRWHSDLDFLDSSGRPLPLKFDGSYPSFSSLVKKYGGDIPAGAMRTELKRVGAIIEDGQGRLAVQMKDFRPVEKEDQIRRALALAVFGLGSSIDHNLNAGPDDNWVERLAFSTRIRRGDSNRVRRISQDRASEFVESVNDLFSAYETIYADEESESETTTIGVGVYYFESMDHDPDIAGFKTLRFSDSVDHQEKNRYSGGNQQGRPA